MPKLLEKRPEPPDLKEILEDLTNSEPDDVAFNFFTVNAKSSQVLEVAHFSGKDLLFQIKVTTKMKCKTGVITKNTFSDRYCPKFCPNMMMMMTTMVMIMMMEGHLNLTEVKVWKPFKLANSIL